MNIEAQKARFNKIDESFAELKKNRRNQNAIRRIEDCLYEVYGYKFTILILETKMAAPCFVMSVFPSESTLDKIIESIINEESVSVIYDLWQQNKAWNIEIDRRVLDDSIIGISSRECTALLLHEVGHTIHSNAIPNRIAKVLKYEYATLSSNLKSVFKNVKFKELLKLPIIDSCTTNSKKENRDSIRAEIYADRHAERLGYGRELESVMDKLISKTESDPDGSMKKTFKFTLDTINNFKLRKGYINQNNFKNILSKTPSVYAANIIGRLKYYYTEGSTETSITDEVRLEMTSNLVNDIMDNYYTEFFLTKKKLKRLPEYDLDYISVEIDKIKTNDDKLLLLSYIRNKIDTVNYYIEILKNDKFARKYEVPHTMEYLEAYKNKLILAINKVNLIKVVEKDWSFTVKYPCGYEG